jgi:hypothetical protein
MTTKKATTKTARKKETLAALAKKFELPIHIRFWLTQYIDEGKGALEHVGTYWNSVYDDFARLIFDVLNAKHMEHGQSEFSKEAVDYVEAYLYRLSQDSGQEIWNNPDIAIAALTVMLDCVNNSEGMSTEFAAVETAIYRLTTESERREFLQGGRYSKPTTEEARNIEASFKLSRVLADPRTPRETRDELELLIREFSMSSRVTVEHPALVKRAFLLMCDAEPQRGRVKLERREMKNDRRKLLALLDTIPDEKGGAG